MARVDGIVEGMRAQGAVRDRPRVAAATFLELIHVNPVSRHHEHRGNKEERSKVHNTVTSYTDR